MPRCKRASLSRDEHCPRCLQQASGFSNSPFLVNLSAPLSSQHFPWGWTWHKCCKRKIGQWRRFLTSPTACHKWGHKCSSQNSPRMYWLTSPPSNLEAQMPSNVQPHQHCQAPNTERLDFEWQSLVTVFCCGVLRPWKWYNWHATGCSTAFCDVATPEIHENVHYAATAIRLACPSVSYPPNQPDSNCIYGPWFSESKNPLLSLYPDFFFAVHSPFQSEHSQGWFCRENITLSKKNTGKRLRHHLKVSASVYGNSSSHLGICATDSWWCLDVRLALAGFW